MKQEMFDSEDDPEIIESILKHARTARKHSDVKKAGTALKVELLLSRSLDQIRSTQPEVEQ